MVDVEPRRYRGGCHCGRVRFSVMSSTRELVDCNCSMCAKKGFLHLIVAREAFTLERGNDVLQTYRFNTGVAQHQFCGVCGIHPFYTPRSHPDGVSVNARCLDDVDLASFSTTSFDGRNWEAHIDEIR